MNIYETGRAAIQCMRMLECCISCPIDTVIWSWVMTQKSISDEPSTLIGRTILNNRLLMFTEFYWFWEQTSSPQITICQTLVFQDMLKCCFSLMFQHVLFKQEQLAITDSCWEPQFYLCFGIQREGYMMRAIAMSPRSYIDQWFSCPYCSSYAPQLLTIFFSLLL